MCSVLDYELLRTEDGSPTIRRKGTHEWMHHPKGAWSETLFIYGKAFDLWFQNRSIMKHNIFSLGLGIGYNEILIAFLMSKYTNDYKMDSFFQQPWQVQTWESNSFLRRQWIDFILQSSSPTEEFFTSLFHQIFSFVDFSPRELIRTKMLTGDWQLYGELKMPFPPSLPVSLVFFDAYSGQTQPELWSKEFLERFLDHYVPDAGVFATYASTGVLKRVLRSRGFELLPTIGFGGKRESTIAIKGS